ncbi:hypothetical protein, variant 1 [Cryptococcus amylolentus CBS 6039]|uniref:N-alpha-acetyltransferase 40 n=1 Tax=Cryptococcus amylolentus CBS 6039 TaxID=1295533 RepID=A0A1E3HMM9_9TREE|nr:hypothetical protein, variant 1 [Cryptococcus amylolentus CBS 6039]ODN77602.1 hypothetical protein, variant 1 [Cryptococcus amylolentus CBS 6039]
MALPSVFVKDSETAASLSAYIRSLACYCSTSPDLTIFEPTIDVYSLLSNMATLRIRTSNTAPPNVLAPNLPLSSRLSNGQPYNIVLFPASALTTGTRAVLFRMLDQNMKTIQDNSSFPYTKESKQEEMFDPTSRFLLALKSSASVPALEGKRPEEMSSVVELTEDDVLGFVEWRFDTEETLRGSDVEVAYLYEIQLTSSSKGLGIGRTLMEILEEIGDRRQMQKVMLTCLKSVQSQCFAILREAGLRSRRDRSYTNGERGL